MDNSTNINKIFKTLPEELQEAIVSVDTFEAEKEVANKYGLYIDQLGILRRETDLVLHGVIDPSQFITVLSEKLNIDRTKANNIVAEINQKIFIPVREHLRGLYDKSSGTVQSQPPATQIAQNKPIDHSSREDLLKSIENPEGMNLSQSAFDRLRGIQPVSVKTPIPAPTMNNTNPTILDEKMRMATNIPKSVNGSPYIKGDPYRE